ncbi:expressed protein [Batrachochytrium dendrobatidis JAM81]|uniref:Expressed protein n=3 Tax=Batrachochytrium dendrobatidis TaxID=109871 RepID=F4NZ99_BATDJ|nr:uncharacterized protein BATDEDRAFT_87274 [Batrachochytrium dendrobatidis JAM81]EGF81854.1 expressed protein [Batrachochytrium dendrobatidis JAM81]OAJ40470.1 hypothetical protein BDEG_24200 [Batrachochytrium dendrobatidis JEL423]|eukprot:XP_006677553.1 expressed protein [Batrachochytrium dendrobatidis JAM81]
MSSVTKSRHTTKTAVQKPAIMNHLPEPDTESYIQPNDSGDDNVSLASDAMDESVAHQVDSQEDSVDQKSEEDDDMPEAISTRATKDSAMAALQAQQKKDKLEKELLKAKRRKQNDINKTQQQQKREKIAATFVRPISIETLEAAKIEKETAVANTKSVDLVEGKHIRLNSKSHKVSKKSVGNSSVSNDGSVRVGNLLVVPLSSQSSQQAKVAESVKNFRMSRLFKKKTKRTSAIDTLARRSWKDTQTMPAAAPFFTK